jgi:hypothetical protein
MDSKDALVVFEGRNIRRTWNNSEWWFVLEDIVYILTDSSDPKQYIQKMKQRDEPLAKGWVQIVHTLVLDTSGGKQKMNCVNTEGAFRIIQSIPSKKAEPFKRWLAKVGYERVQEIEDPELAQKRMKELYKLKGYSEDWVETKNEYSILTSEISKATFGLTPGEYKKLKGLKQHNLRDHMNDLFEIYRKNPKKVVVHIMRNANFAFKCVCSFYEMRARNLMNQKLHFEDAK